MAPPPKPMIAMPVAMPRRSGNHFTSVDTGEMYPSPRPKPPITPEPSHSSHSWWPITPIAPRMRPPHHRIAAATPALRGPARSTHPPNTAADSPRNTKKRVYIQPRLATFQSHVVVKSSLTIDMSGHDFEEVRPIARDSGSQNTENP